MVNVIVVVVLFIEVVACCGGGGGRGGRVDSCGHGLGLVIVLLVEVTGLMVVSSWW